METIGMRKDQRWREQGCGEMERVRMSENPDVKTAERCRVERWSKQLM